jgi:hypothetical protein
MPQTSLRDSIQETIRRVLRHPASTPRVRPLYLFLFLSFAALYSSACENSPLDPIATVEETPVANQDASATPARTTESVKDLSVSTADHESVTLSWTEVADDNGGPASYETRYAKSPLGQGWQNATVAVMGSCVSPMKGSKVGATVTCIVEGLETGTAYDFQVAAFRTNQGGQVKTAPTLSNITSATTYAATPGNVIDLSAGAVTATSATVSWTQVEDGMGGASSYELRHTLSQSANTGWDGATVVTSGTCAAPVAGTQVGAAISCAIDGLEAGRTYDVRLVAFRAGLDGNRTYSAERSNLITVTTAAATPTVPGKVSDLVVSGAAENSVQLSWTPVSDGAGGMAKYQVRYATTPLGYGWGDATAVTTGSCAPAVSAGAMAELGSCTVDGLQSGKSYDFQVVAFRTGSDGSVTYGAALSNVATGITTAVVEPPAANGSNEPSGYGTLVETSYQAAAEGGFSSSLNADFSIVNDPTAPYSPGTVARARFPKGLGDGVSPIWSAAGIGQHGVKRLYVSFWMKVSDNWQGHETGVNKVAILWTHEKPVVVANMNGVGSGRLMSEMRIQDVPDGARNLTANLADAELARGEWHRWEVVLVSNNGDGADGEVHWWIDGNKVGEYRDVRFGTSAQSKIWDNVTWRPVWGGRGDTVNEDMYMWMDHYYASGAK